MAGVEKFIVGGEKLVAVFGYWPSFHDAEVVEFNLWRGDVDPDRGSYVFPVLTAKIHLWEMTREIDANRFFVLRHHTLATLRFEGIEETFTMSGFNYQNAILELYITRCERSDGPSPYFDVTFSPAFGMGASFKCSRVEVVDAVTCNADGKAI